MTVSNAFTVWWRRTITAKVRSRPSMRPASRSAAASPTQIARPTSRSCRTCARKARPTMPRFRWYSPTAASTSRPGRRDSRAASPPKQFADLEFDHRAAGAGRGDPRAAAHVGKSDRHLCRSSDRRAHSLRQDPPRLCRGDPRRDLAVGHARLHARSSERLPPQALIDRLNLYFGCQVPAVLGHGGEVLKFMGDGLLAIFPIAAESEVGEVCRAHARLRAKLPSTASPSCRRPARTRRRSASGSRFMSAKSCMAISAAAIASISPASDRR